MKGKIKLLMIMIVFIWSSSLFSDTVLHLYRPYAGSEHHPAPKVSEVLDGHCRDQSHHIKREDAWRCYAAGKVFDPCFIKRFSSQHEVICPESPWMNKAVKIRTDTTLDDQSHERLDMALTYPWAVELENGMRCISDDLEEVINGLPVHYRCEDGSFLIGHLQRCKALWSMLNDVHGSPSTVNIAKAWF
ncbi:hypothetical protein GCM10007966_07490 [Legionella impletisoli]|uniref:Uncharacterized protein n=2 Tax=Legionella impletisoli TaxID=343510 RepID=A0A917JSC3_9GAMM|nr:hypothetical protein [Legionella impletisoli]GGI81540.1 hypothetical protein GCM10007966_07490 [Legionella impletisoli]